MIDPKSINDIVSNFMENLPEGLKNLPDDLKSHMRESFSQAMSKMDIVTREEFEVQQRVLLRTREKLEALEKKLDAFEK